MKKTFRDHHLYRVLEAFDFTTPLDLYLGHYFRQHKAIGSKDRKVIAEKVYSMIRWLGLIDHHCDGNHTWENRYEVWKELNIPQKIQNPLLPPHIRASCPKELFALLHTHFGEEKALAFCHVSNQPAPTTVRVNPLKTNRLALFAEWKDQFAVSLTPLSVHGICFENKLNFHLLDDFKQGSLKCKTKRVSSSLIWWRQSRGIKFLISAPDQAGKRLRLPISYRGVDRSTCMIYAPAL